jgi:hypothetical protein
LYVSNGREFFFLIFFYPLKLTWFLELPLNQTNGDSKVT